MTENKQNNLPPDLRSSRNRRELVVERSEAQALLAKMKKIEARKVREGKLRTFHLDSKTIVCATKERMKEIVTEYGKKSVRRKKSKQEE